MSLTDEDLSRRDTHLRRVFDVAIRSRELGNHPFGALLVDGQGNVLLEAVNTVITERDSTGHAETNLVRLASQRYEADVLAECTMYASTEPCPMCSGAVHWGNIGRVVYGLSQDRLHDLVQGATDDGSFTLSCREVLAGSRKAIEVVGPVLEEEAVLVHHGYWDNL